MNDTCHQWLSSLSTIDLRAANEGGVLSAHLAAGMRSAGILLVDAEMTVDGVRRRVHLMPAFVRERVDEFVQARSSRSGTLLGLGRSLPSDEDLVSSVSRLRALLFERDLEIENLRQTLDSRVRIEQATGIVMASSNCSAERARELLDARAEADDVRLDVLADMLLAHRATIVPPRAKVRHRRARGTTR